MNYQKINAKEYNLHLIDNNRFHTLEFSIIFTEEVNKEKISYRNALISILTYATEKYDRPSKLMKKSYDLYSLYPKVSVSRYGNLMRTKFSISIINSKYISKENLLDNILFIKEIILNPLLDEKMFTKKYFDIVKHELQAETLTIIEEPRLYANYSLLKNLSDTENYSLTGYTDLNILNKMTCKDLYNSYCEMLEKSKIDIFIAGNISNKQEIIDCINENYIFNNKFKKLRNPIINHRLKRNNPKLIVEEKKYQQSKISIAFKCYQLTEFENRYVLHLLNIILGSSGNSLFMRNVREKNGLCYYIGTYYNRLDNLIILNSGINKENYDKTIITIQEVIKKVQEGKLSNSDIKNAKKEYLCDIDNLKESNVNLIEYYYGMEVFKSDLLDTKIAMIKKITKDDIIEVAKKINLDTIFFLKGDL